MVDTICRKNGNRSISSSNNSSEKSGCGSTGSSEKSYDGGSHDINTNGQQMIGVIGSDGSSLPTVGNRNKTNPKILRHNNKDSLGHFIDSVRATG